MQPFIRNKQIKEIKCDNSRLLLIYYKIDVSHTIFQIGLIVWITFLILERFYINKIQIYQSEQKGTFFDVELN